MRRRKQFEVGDLIALYENPVDRKKHIGRRLPPPASPTYRLLVSILLLFLTVDLVDGGFGGGHDGDGAVGTRSSCQLVFVHTSAIPNRHPPADIPQPGLGKDSRMFTQFLKI